MKTEGDIAAIRYNLGNRIRTLREGQDLSQYTFARMIELDRTYLIGVEKGRRNVSIDNLCKIARGLDISLSELCKGVDDPESVQRKRRLTEDLLHHNSSSQAD